jgi:hypothetical protein
LHLQHCLSAGVKWKKVKKLYKLHFYPLE